MPSLARVFSLVVAGGLFALACGGASDPTPAGSSGSNPGKVTCETAECDVAGGYACCSHDARPCMKGCPNSASFELHCDESADCTVATVNKCCSFGLSAVCQSECTDGPQLCKTQAECGAAGCSLKTCNGHKMQVCGTPAGCQ